MLFDLDDTLFAHRESVEAGIAAHRSTLGGALVAADGSAEFARWNALEEPDPACRHPCLEALRPARFGVITNGSLEFQMAKINGVGLTALLEHVIASGEVGVHTDAIGAARAGLLGVTRVNNSRPAESFRSSERSFND